MAGDRSGLLQLANVPLVVHLIGDDGLCERRGSRSGFQRKIGFPVVLESPDALRFPEPEEDHRGNHGGDAGGDVHQVAVHIVGPEKLHAREGDTDD
jgi:hypothetical protein